MSDIITRLNDPELYVDAIDDAIVEIQRLRSIDAGRCAEVVVLRRRIETLQAENARLRAALESIKAETTNLLRDEIESLSEILEMATAAIQAEKDVEK